MNNIKDYRENELKQYVVATSLLFLLLHGFIDFSNPQNIDYIKGIVSFIGTSILTSVIYIFTLVIDGVMDDKLKNVIVNLWFIQLYIVIYLQMIEKKEFMKIANGIKYIVSIEKIR